MLQNPNFSGLDPTGGAYNAPPDPLADEMRIFSVSENGHNGLGDEGAGAMPTPELWR